MQHKYGFLSHIPKLELMIFAISSLEVMAQDKIVINEFMQSNVDFMMVDHDFPDSWVELYNGSDQQLSICDYRIGPSENFDDCYRITTENIYIAPGGHLLLFCDKTKSTPFHYSFNLEAGKGALFLFDDSGNLVDSINYRKMPAPNVAYGRVTDGSDEWQYELTPTPEAPNNSVGSDEVLPEPLFSVEGHLITNGPEYISVSMPEGVPEDTRIYLTLDGSEPTWESPSSTLFTLNIDKSTVIRAKLLSHQALPIRSTTHSYIFHPRTTTLPIVSIATDSTYLYSSEEGIISNDSTGGQPNYSYDWRRPGNFEYFDRKEGTTVFNQCGEMAVAGASTRSLPQKSIKCYAKNRFGKKYFKGNFWHDKPNVTKIKSFTLRNGGNKYQSARFNDAALQRFFGTHLEGLDWQAYEPVIVYINGVYKGIYGFRERSNEDYVTSNYDVNEEEVEIADAANYRSSKVSGSPEFNAFRKLYSKSDVTYDELDKAMNVENFMNAFIAECYSSNTDYPQNNIAIWKQIGEDYQWRWILKDLDFVAKHEPSWDMFKYMLGTDDEQAPEYGYSMRSTTVKARFLYERMNSFPEFRNRFIATYATYLGDFLRPDICLPIVSEMNNQIIDEIGPTFAAYDNMSTLKKHNSYVERFKSYITERPDFVYRQMADYFMLGDVIPVSIVAEDMEEDARLTLCDIPLRTGRFDGAWFTNFPLSLGTNEESIWNMVVTHADGSESVYFFPDSDIQLSLTSCILGGSVAFISTKATDDIVQSTYRYGSNDVIAIYDVAGMKRDTLQRGLNIIIYADGKRRIIKK